MNKLPTFTNQKLLEQALTHRSAINERGSHQDNERLEFLGDAVLEVVVSEFLYQHFPNKTEGDLTQTRAALVRTETLSDIAKSLGVPSLVITSKGERRASGHTNPSLLADTMEAIIGALFLDKGLEQTKQFISQTLLTDLDLHLKKAGNLDAKSKYQEKIQAMGHETPSYHIVSQEGPDHNRTFTAEVSVEGKPTGNGKGRSKQDAEQEAARNALAKLGVSFRSETTN